ncbi:type II toxin-antitoxin system MqsA family antitoxin [Thermoflexus hugenholtzii]|uniref:YgiT-type zinc finger domain-containing protein n=1 Tax=Thermoflexus hugenholtzii JAD2 TaxID=877466 RepID=A0A212R584_9CHLR|nr:type II toxin-antitoxin system MqsA family antitoxin [Thermoflexus hugenholtzii]SNB67219.1 YgiT-type zinc finger domain-containing protein [Thermoflexus hugenholtzii JAD2]
MKCVICKHGETRPGTTTIVFQRAGATLVIRNVPGEICQNCGEVYLSPEVAQELLAKAEDALRAGVVVDVREFLPAVA